MGVPAINVNLAACRCPVPAASPQHWAEQCAAKPVLIPCRPPPSFTCTVVLGECIASGCGNAFSYHTLPTGMSMAGLAIHSDSCPARPVKVSCSISGTWEESEVVQVEYCPAPGRLEDFLPGHPVFDACRDRWALVKALVTNDWTGWALTADSPILTLQSQRDAVYAALARLEAADSAARAAHSEAFSALDAADVEYSTMTPVGSRAAAMLAAYVKRLITTVGRGA